MKGNKILILIIISIIISLEFIFPKFLDKKTEKLVNYRGNNLMISIDGFISTTFPTSGTYYLTSYECDDSNTKVVWNPASYELMVTNGKSGGGVSCDLSFESNPKLSEMLIGSYVAYTGSGGTVGSTSVACKKNGSASSSTEDAETEAPNSCSGQNAREDLYTSGYTYGYCYSTDNKYYTTGWRIAYIDTTDASNPKAVIVSAGSPECNTRTESTANVTYIQTANAKALKYCNTNYVDGNCTCTDNDADGLCDSPSTDAWAINDTDFYYMTKAISGYGKRLASSSSSLGDSGGALGTTLYCDNKFSYQECGYNNDLLDNGGWYWFAAHDSSSTTSGPYWYPGHRAVYNGTYTYAYGLRPVISLSSSVYVTGGTGTMADPYTIGNAKVTINGGSIGLDRTLTIFSTDATTMCFSNTSSSASDCTDWVTYAISYNWRLSDGIGTKTVYAFFKNASGNIHSTMATIEITSEVEESFSVNEDFADTTYDPNITVSGSGSYPWTVSSGQFHSSNQGKNSTTSSSTIQFTPTLDAILSFDYGVSSETNYDKLTITLSGSDSSSNTLVSAISGTKSGSITNRALTSGVTYTLTLSYSKDSSSASGSDIGYIDNLVIQPRT